MFLGKRKTKPGHNPFFFFHTKSLGSNRITIEPQAHPLKNMLVFKMILTQSRAHYVFFMRFSSKLFTYFVQRGNVGKKNPTTLYFDFS
jgi:hypothetical protein